MPRKRIFCTVHVEPVELFVLDSNEKTLLWAILKRALEDTLSEDPTIKRDAEAWLCNMRPKRNGSLFWVLDNISNNTTAAYNAIRKLADDKEALLLLKQKHMFHRVG